jgi:hypothetical protein
MAEAKEQNGARTGKPGTMKEKGLHGHFISCLLR